MDIESYKDAIKAWVEDQAGITAQWRDEKGGWQAKTRARLHLSSPRSLGVDHLGWAQADEGLPAGADFVPQVSGNRTITLSILVQSRNQSGSNVAIWYLEKLRTSLRKPSVRAALYAAGLAHSTSEAALDLDVTVDCRKESQASLDVHFNAVVNEKDEAGADSFVQTTGIKATLETPAGDDAGWPDTEFP